MSHLTELGRVQTGIRLERRLMKVLKATAQLYDLSLGDFLEKVIHSTFAGRHPFSDAALAQIAELARIYGLEPLPPHVFRQP